MMFFPPSSPQVLMLRELKSNCVWLISTEKRYTHSSLLSNENNFRYENEGARCTGLFEIIKSFNTIFRGQLRIFFCGV